MDKSDQDRRDWTPHLVERRLVEAFKALPGHPVFSRHGRIAEKPDSELGALNWVGRFVPDRRDGLALLTWARCRATGASFRGTCGEMGWPQSSAEHGRRRALSRIVAGLSQGDVGD